MKIYILLIVLWGISLTRGIGDPFPAAEKAGVTFGESALKSSEPGIMVDDLRQYVTRLASDEFEGRGTGDPGERLATAYFATFLEGLGLQPAGDRSTFFQEFSFRAGMELKGENSLTVEGVETGPFKPGETYQPLSLSSSGKVAADVVFVGFGIEHGDYNSFKGIDVKGKWLLTLRGSPTGRDDLQKFAPLMVKARLAKEKGAAGVLFIKASSSATGPELIPPTISVGPTHDVLPALTISNDLAARLLAGEKSEGGLKTIFESYNKGEKINGHPLPIRVSSEIGLGVDNDSGRNVLGRLVVGEKPSAQAIVIGGHIDHLGYGNRGGTRAGGKEATKLHPGADDNASGIAVIMEVAQYFADQKRAGKLNLDRDIIFAAWSGEEVGLYGSQHYIKEARKVTDKIVYPGIAAYINLDMVGRASGKGLTLNGTASSADWKGVLDRIIADPDLKIHRSPSPWFPSDATAFYVAGVPVLSAFTGTHDDYHTPNDTVDKIDFDGLGSITNYMKILVEELARLPKAPGYVEVPRKRPDEAPKVIIGIRMEEAEGHGIKVTEVIKDSPAEKAGIQVADTISEVNGAVVKNLEGFFGELNKLKPGTTYPIVVRRVGEKIDLKIIPGAR